MVLAAGNSQRGLSCEPEGVGRTGDSVLEGSLKEAAGIHYSELSK